MRMCGTSWYFQLSAENVGPVIKLKRLSPAINNLQTPVGHKVNFSSVPNLKDPPLFSTPEKNVKKDLRNRTVALILATEWFHKTKHET
jgi:hypothetical protein